MANETDDAWEYLKAGDAISGKEGTLYATIDGQVVPIAEVKNISAKITKNKVEFKSLGYRGTQHKATGWSGTGSMAIHYVTSRWTDMMVKYTEKGVDNYFKLTITNKDPTSSIGTQTITLLDCNIDEAEVAKLDVDADFLEQTMGFTFSGIAISSKFTK